ncbi:MAG: cation-translocating P-type ATPase, partial [Gammaproteobacteria bacterium]|nr:cation-translocating P-type ATPase [Gammaproteobacteria bacterium]
AALVDESLVTGESQPRSRAPGETLLGGSTNLGAALSLRAARRADESTLHGLVRLLERAQGERPRLGLAAERMASWFVLRVLALTLAVGVAWAFIDPSRLLPAVLAVLVATCPCALSLATPVAIAAATSRLAKLGVLVMRADAVEGLATIDTVMLDKTGTLTAGRPTVTKTEVLESPGAPSAPRPLTPARALAIAAALEQGSRHPLALAFAAHRDATLDCADARETAGEGVEGHVGGGLWRIGKAAFALALHGAAPHGPIGEARLRDAAAVLASDDGQVALFEVEDALRPDALATVEALRKSGLDLQVASGDRPEVVARVAATLGLTAATGALRPEDKLQRLRAAQQAGHRVLMVGDGINDGPVLAAADVSMAMGRGSSIAHAAGDLLLLRESLAALPAAVAVSRRALTLVRQNLRWAAAYNLAAIPVAALGLMPPWVAAIGMSASSLIVVFNARRLLRTEVTVP